ncbi:Dbl homology domain-containing protein [Chytridium lagenaria]|nr:Dbl homology domain-containing protein [Chytridium lagenaria]
MDNNAYYYNNNGVGRSDTSSSSQTSRTQNSYNSDFTNDLNLALPVLDDMNHPPQHHAQYNAQPSPYGNNPNQYPPYQQQYGQPNQPSSSFFGARQPPPHNQYHSEPVPQSPYGSEYQPEQFDRFGDKGGPIPEADVITKAAAALASLKQFTHFDTEPVPKGMDPPLLRSPLFSADAIVFLNPYLVDAIGATLPEDAWEYISMPIQGTSSSVDVPNTPEYHIIKEGIRGYAILEVLTTERTYFKDLNVIHNTIRNLIIERNLLSRISITKIFAGMEELYQLHNTFLARLEEILSPDQWIAEESSLATIFLEFKEEMAKHYIVYINNYSAATKQLSQRRRITRECTKSEEIKHGLKDLLVRPMQRMTKYPLLIREIDKRTSTDHPDSANLKSALDSMNQLATTVNEKMSEMVKLISLFQAFDATLNCPPTLLNSNRRCIVNIDAFDRANKPIRLYLCSDLLMVVTHQTKVFAKAQQKYKFLRWLDLLEMKVEELTNDIVKITLNEDARMGSLTTPNSPRVTNSVLTVWIQDPVVAIYASILP